MLERFYEPQSGCVLVDGRPLSQYDHTYLHNRISLVGQEPVLYARSVADNISYSLEGASQEDIERAAKLANAHDFIMATTDGYDTQTGEKGLLYLNHLPILSVTTLTPTPPSFPSLQVPSSLAVRSSVWPSLVL